MIPFDLFTLSEHLDFLGITLKATFGATRKANGEILQERIKQVINLVYFFWLRNYSLVDFEERSSSVDKITVVIFDNFPFLSSGKVQDKVNIINQYIDRIRRNFPEKEMETESSWSWSLSP